MFLLCIQLKERRGHQPRRLLLLSSGQVDQAVLEKRKKQEKIGSGRLRRVKGSSDGFKLMEFFYIFILS
jgi:hypothetical protein